MKKLFFAALIAATAATSFSIPAQAASTSLTITTSDSGNREFRRDHRRNDRREVHRKKHHREVRQHRRERDCFMKKVKVRNHGHFTVRKIRVCK